MAIRLSGSTTADMPAASRTQKPFLSRVRVFGLKLCLLLLTVCFCLMLMEWGVRRLFPYFDPRAQLPFLPTTNGIALGLAGQTVRQATPKGDYDLQVRFNEDGLRDSKSLRDSTEADWFAVGDSFTMGWGVQERERFSSRLEQAFRTNGIPARVFNVAVPENIIGYQRLLHYAESRGAKVRHLIVGLCMENDLRDYSDGKSAWEVDTAPRSNSPASTKERVRSWFKGHSALYIAASFSLQRIPWMRRCLERMGVARDIEQLSGQNQWSEVILNTSRDELVKLVSSRDALILVIPSRHLWTGSNQATEKRIHEALIQRLRTAGLRVVDVRQAIEAQGDPLSCHFETDPHWNARGHAIAAEELFKAVSSQSLEKRAAQ